jgi:hypothetical protein
VLKKEFYQRIYNMSVTLCVKHPSSSTVRNWVARFRTGLLSTEGEDRSGRPTQVTITENVDATHSMILDDRRISARKTYVTLEISQERVDYIIFKILDMRKLLAKWVAKCLNANQKGDRVLASQAILDRFRRDPVWFLNSRNYG